jgi:cell wall assembly regulator SMI1
MKYTVLSVATEEELNEQLAKPHVVETIRRVAEKLLQELPGPVRIVVERE